LVTLITTSPAFSQSLRPIKISDVIFFVSTPRRRPLSLVPSPLLRRWRQWRGDPCHVILIPRDPGSATRRVCANTLSVDLLVRHVAANGRYLRKRDARIRPESTWSGHRDRDGAPRFWAESGPSVAPPVGFVSALSGPPIASRRFEAQHTLLYDVPNTECRSDNQQFARRDRFCDESAMRIREACKANALPGRTS
jgi:hypothetical protein